jgi:hypothetical protein
MISATLGATVAPPHILTKFRAYPYGLTEDKIARLKVAGINTVLELADTTEDRLLQIDMVAPATVKRTRDVILQAVWM